MRLRKGIVVDTHPEDHSVDLVLCDDGARLTGVPVLAQSASARSGGVDMPEVPKKADKWDITKRDGQDMEAYVGYMGAGNPVVVGFVYPQVSQMTFEDKKRRFNRHQSDVYTTVTGTGDVELYHPSGVYIRIAEDPKHENLEGKNFDKSLALDRNTDKKLYVRVYIPDSGMFQMDPNGNALLRMMGKINIEADGAIRIDSKTSITMTAPRIDLN